MGFLFSSSEKKKKEEQDEIRERGIAAAKQRAREREVRTNNERRAQYDKDNKALEESKEADITEIKADLRAKEDELRKAAYEEEKRMREEFERMKKRETEQQEKELVDTKLEIEAKSKDMISRISTLAADSEKVENELDKIDERKLIEQIFESEKTDQLRKHHQAENQELDLKLEEKRAENEKHNLEKLIKAEQDCMKEEEANHKMVSDFQNKINQACSQDAQQIVKIKVAHSSSQSISAVNKEIESLKTGFLATLDYYIEFARMAFTEKNRTGIKEKNMRNCLDTHLTYLDSQLSAHSNMKAMESSISQLNDVEKQKELVTKIKETKKKITKARFCIPGFSLESGWEKERETEFKSLMESISTCIDSFDFLQSGTMEAKNLVLEQKKI